MGIFRKANNKLEGLVEGGFGRAFKSSVQPVELAHKLAKEMGDHKTVGVSNVYVPNEFDVYLGKDDYDHLVSFEDSLKTELSNYVTAFARREGWTLVAPPRIELHCDDDLRVGEFGIATRTMGAPVEMPDAGAFAAPAAVVPPAAAAAPGPVIDQTVLYQEPACRCRCRVRAPRRRAASCAAARATTSSRRRSPSSAAAGAATSSSPTPTSRGSTPRSASRTTASCCSTSAPPTARASTAATSSRSCCSTETASSSAPPSSCSRGSPDREARVTTAPACGSGARRRRVP